MSLVDHLGQRVTLKVVRLIQHGAALAAPDDDGETVLLPAREVPEGLAPGDVREVFLYRDSEDRLTATLKQPRLALGEVAFLRATEVVPFGVFFDWGLAKELLVPKAEMTRDVRPGERCAIGLVRDRSGRLAGTMRVAELLAEPPGVAVGEWVEGVAWRGERGLGLFVILGRRSIGLLPADEPHDLAPGQVARLRVAAVLPDGKVRLSLRGPAHAHIADDAEVVFGVLSRPGAARFGDDSEPEAIRAAFGLSKKAFKRAVGRLLKAGRVTLAPDGAILPR